jgi:hypothetical protein
MTLEANVAQGRKLSGFSDLVYRHVDEVYKSCYA